ncbi:hypothetical protein Tco_0586463 [Tanacetum coccineum]
MYEIGRPYDGNKFFVTLNFTGYGVMYRDLLGQRGEDNLGGVQIGYNSLYTIRPIKVSHALGRKELQHLRGVKWNTVGLDMEVVIRVKVKVETKVGVDLEVAFKIQIRVEVSMCLQVDNEEIMAVKVEVRVEVAMCILTYDASTSRILGE